MKKPLPVTFFAPERPGEVLDAAHFDSVVGGNGPYRLPPPPPPPPPPPSTPTPPPTGHIIIVPIEP